MGERVLVNGARLLDNLSAMSTFGINPHGGIDRAFAQESDRQVRAWILEMWARMGLETGTDAIANLWGKKHGSENLAPIVFGSHHDAVPDGGKYDGAMGVIIATEIMQTILERQIPTRHPLAVVSFTAEEPNAFNLSTLGSKVLCGRLAKEDLLSKTDRSGKVRLEDAVKELGGNLHHLDEARLHSGDIAACLEAHNELGRQLEIRDLSVGAAASITGIYREKITVTGESNHAGTTMMQDRKDAFLSLSEIAAALERGALQRNSPEVTATMGYVNLHPNEANIIPGSAEGIIDIRTSNDEDLQFVLGFVEEAAEKARSRRGVQVLRECLLDQKAQPLDPFVREAILHGMAAEGEPEVTLTSMAGHDAANMQRIAPSGMIFVRSVGGYGHCRREYCRPEDIVKAANAMLFAVLELDQSMDAAKPQPAETAAAVNWEAAS